MTRRSNAEIGQPMPHTKFILGKKSVEDTLTHQRHSKVEVSILQQHVARLPHGMDESADHATSEPRRIIEHAAADVSNGLKDTDRGAQTNRTYKKLKAGP